MLRTCAKVIELGRVSVATRGLVGVSEFEGGLRLPAGLFED